MRIRATVVKALASGALLAGVAGGVGVQVAHAATVNNFYVAANGSDGPGGSGNSCTNKAEPCATLAHAVTEANAVNSAGPNTIFVAKGTYDQTINLEGESNLTIQGAVTKSGKIKTTFAATATGAVFEAGLTTPNTATVVTGLNLIEDGGATLGAAPPSGPGTTGVAVTAGTTLQNSTVGATSAPDTAILNEATTVDNVTVAGATCSDVTKSGVALGSPTGTLVTLSKKVPKCAGTLSNSTVTASVTDPTPTSHSVTESIVVNQDGKKALVLTSPGPTGTPNLAIPAGSTLAFASTVSAYQDYGVLSSGGTTENSAFDGSGGGTQIGIEAGAGSTSTGNKVNGNGEAGIQAEVSTGIITVGGVTSGAGNSGSSNGVGISVDGQTGSTGTVAVTDNSVGGVSAGLAATCLNTSGAVANIEGNTISESAEEGAGLTLLGVKNQANISGNTISGTIATLIADGTSSTACSGVGSSGNTLTDNTVSNGLLFGVVVTGAYDPADVVTLGMAFGLGVSQSGNTGNTFTGNTWSGNGEANLVDLNSFFGQVAPACTNLTTTAAIPAATAVTSVSVKTATTCTLNPGTTLSAPAGNNINQTLYVTSAATILSTNTSGTTVNVSNFIPLASSQLNAAGLPAPSTLTVDAYGMGSNATSNTYNANSPQPDFNGSSSLDAATGSAGYYSA
jgi:hypothetical protein